MIITTDEPYLGVKRGFVAVVHRNTKTGHRRRSSCLMLDLMLYVEEWIRLFANSEEKTGCPKDLKKLRTNAKKYNKRLSSHHPMFQWKITVYVILCEVSIIMSI